ncbi:QsdR family transcriptional regulator [Nocardia sp. NPDC051832]|uniref:QsdR family transcriptional regulator n=1 Tax=Nocardia sp. NPDC051832 TaxID=3155673 RepID=UPI003443EBBB
MGPEHAAVEPPTFRRPTAADAHAAAIWLFDRRERVDMHTVAARLGIGRSTLYRWVGDREQLMDHVILESIGELWRSARRNAQGENLERALDAARLFMLDCVRHEPLTHFARREPNLALRVLLDPDGLVTAALQSALAHEVATAAPDLDVPAESFRVLAMTATAVVWANVAADRTPDIEAAISIMRTVLSAHH